MPNMVIRDKTLLIAGCF